MSLDRDSGYLRFRRGSVKLGCASALVACAFVLAYIAGTWGERPHRATLLVLVAASIASAVGILVARAERIVDTRWCDLFFGVWSTFYVAIIGVFGMLDGGASSPLIALLFPVLVFAGLCYPRGLAIVVGAACVLGDVAIGVLSDTRDYDQVLFVTASLLLTAAMCVWQAHTLEHQRRELALASRTDHLTGALNRRGFYERAAAELARAARSGDPVSLVLVDLDGFKRVNDAHGHAAGDELLCWVVGRLRAGLRPSDAAARLGGDEFALLLPGIDQARAEAVATRLRMILGERTGASLGVSAFPAGQDTEALLALADAELYRDKARGRNSSSAALRLGAAESFWA